MLLLAISMAAAAPQCAIPAAEVTRLLALTYEKFDTDQRHSGWRQLNARGCTAAALSLLARYEAANGARLSREMRSEIAFHAGQALALAGREGEAIPHFERALSIGGSEEWTSYVAANLAFIKRDLPSLRSARSRYAAEAPGSMRLKFIDGFLACPNDGYMKAAHCAM